MRIIVFHFLCPFGSFALSAALLGYILGLPRALPFIYGSATINTYSIAETIWQICVRLLQPTT